MGNLMDLDGWWYYQSFLSERVPALDEIGCLKPHLDSINVTGEEWGRKCSLCSSVIQGIVSDSILTIMKW